MSNSKNKKTIKIPLDTDFNKQWAKALQFKFCNSHILGTLAFPEGQDESEYSHVKRIVEAMESEGVDKKKIFAFIKTGRLLTVDNVKFASPDDKKEWIDATRQYERLIMSGAIQTSDSLEPFITASKIVPNPKKERNELEQLFDTRKFHEVVVEVARNQFINYDFPNAVFNAYKKLIITVQEKSGNFSEDGTPLMTYAFNSRKPVLLSPLARWTGDASIQEGIMHLFMGSVLSVRNVFAHKDVYLTDPGQTLEYLSFSSFLFKILDTMELVEKEKEISSNSKDGKK